MKLFLLIFLILCNSKSLVALDTKSTHAIILDYETEDILFSKKENELTSPASMTKIMTAYIVFDRIKNGNLKLSDEFIISSKAYKMGGSRMFLEMNSKVTVMDLLYGIIVQSGNDASVAVAENISGTEEEFAKLMNTYANKFGMNNTNFVNSSGWPNSNHYSSMKDIAILSKNIIKHFPELYKIFEKKKFIYNNIRQPNRNPLLYSYEGADGLKTGYVNNAGFGIAATVDNNGRRIIVVVNGLKSARERKEEVTKLFDWAYRDTKQIVILNKGQILVKSDVWLGNKKTVNLISGEKLLTSLTLKQQQNIEAKLVYKKPINAPLEKNQEVGKILIDIPNRQTIEIPLLAKDSIKKSNPLTRIFNALNYLIFGNIDEK